MKKIKKYSEFTRHYLPLMSVLAAGAIGFIIFSFDRVFQGFILICVAASYVVWGIVHHKVHKDLHWKIVVEYVLIAALGLTIVFSLLYRA